MRLSDAIAVVTCLAAAAGCTGRTDACGRELSREELLTIVETEKGKQSGEPLPHYETEITIDREGCDYVYFEQRVPPVPGGHLQIRIDQHGRVIEFVPGA